ncbi:hypothetical protein SNEBB_004379 [Seison nebaliae]|nr:hypothetical protein SNEBB_004379 [Seison nebaliae]
MFFRINNKTQMRESTSHDFIRNLDLLFKKKSLCDIDLISSEGEKISAHRSVLAAVSPFFYALFTSSMKDAKNRSIRLKTIDMKTLKFALTIIYQNDNHHLTDDMQLKTYEDVAKLLDASHLLQCDTIREFSEMNFLNGINGNNWIHYLQTASLYDFSKNENFYPFYLQYDIVEPFCSILRRKVFNFILQNLNEVCSNGTILLLKYENILQIFSADNLFIENKNSENEDLFELDVLYFALQLITMKNGKRIVSSKIASLYGTISSDICELDSDTESDSDSTDSDGMEEKRTASDKTLVNIKDINEMFEFASQLPLHDELNRELFDLVLLRIRWPMINVNDFNRIILLIPSMKIWFESNRFLSLFYLNLLNYFNENYEQPLMLLPSCILSIKNNRTGIIMRTRKKLQNVSIGKKSSKRYQYSFLFSSRSRFIENNCIFVCGGLQYVKEEKSERIVEKKVRTTCLNLKINNGKMLSEDEKEEGEKFLNYELIESNNSYLRIPNISSSKNHLKEIKGLTNMKVLEFRGFYYFLGGCTAPCQLGEYATNVVWRYDSHRHQWKQLPSMKYARAYFYACIIPFFEQNTTNNQIYKHDKNRSNFSLNDLIESETFGMIIVVGGRNSEGLLNCVEMFDMRINEWTTVINKKMIDIDIITEQLLKFEECERNTKKNLKRMNNGLVSDDENDEEIESENEGNGDGDGDGNDMINDKDLFQKKLRIVKEYKLKKKHFNSQTVIQQLIHLPEARHGHAGCVVVRKNVNNINKITTRRFGKLLNKKDKKYQLIDKYIDSVDNEFSSVISIYVMGGFVAVDPSIPSATGYTNNVLRLDICPYTQTVSNWIEQTPMNHVRSWHSACYVDDRIIVCGGIGNDKRPIYICECFDIHEQKWYEIDTLKASFRECSLILGYLPMLLEEEKGDENKVNKEKIKDYLKNEEVEELLMQSDNFDRTLFHLASPLCEVHGRRKTYKPTVTSITIIGGSIDLVIGKYYVYEDKWVNIPINAKQKKDGGLMRVSGTVSIPFNMINSPTGIPQLDTLPFYHRNPKKTVQIESNHEINSEPQQQQQQQLQHQQHQQQHQQQNQPNGQNIIQDELNSDHRRQRRYSQSQISRPNDIIHEDQRIRQHSLSEQIIQPIRRQPQVQEQPHLRQEHFQQPNISPPIGPNFQLTNVSNVSSSVLPIMHNNYSPNNTNSPITSISLSQSPNVSLPQFQQHPSQTQNVHHPQQLPILHSHREPMQHQSPQFAQQQPQSLRNSLSQQSEQEHIRLRDNLISLQPFGLPSQPQTQNESIQLLQRSQQHQPQQMPTHRLAEVDNTRINPHNNTIRSENSSVQYRNGQEENNENISVPSNNINDLCSMILHRVDQMFLHMIDDTFSRNRQSLQHIIHPQRYDQYTCQSKSSLQSLQHLNNTLDDVSLTPNSNHHYRRNTDRLSRYSETITARPSDQVPSNSTNHLTEQNPNYINLQYLLTNMLRTSSEQTSPTEISNNTIEENEEDHPET